VIAARLTEGTAPFR